MKEVNNFKHVLAHTYSLSVYLSQSLSFPLSLPPFLHISKIGKATAAVLCSLNYEWNTFFFTYKIQTIKIIIFPVQI